MPVFNVEKYLRQCLESAVKQTLREIEIIVVDDGSTDSSGTIADEFAACDQRVKVIHKENGGYGKAVNVGMDAAAGKYFAILESDDIIPENMMQDLYEIAESTGCDIVKGNFCKFVEENGRLVKEDFQITAPDMYDRIINVQDELEKILLDTKVYTWSGIYKREFLYRNKIRHNETPGASYQDNGFFFLTMSSAETVYFSSKYFYKLRRDNPNSSFYSKGKVYCMRDEYDYIWKFITEDNERYKKTVPYYCVLRFRNYIFTCRRIAPEYRLEYLHHFQESLVRFDSFMQQRLFPRKNWELMQKIKNSPQAALKFFAEKDREMYAHPSWYQRVAWCYEDNGFFYTAKHIFKRIIARLFK